MTTWINSTATTTILPLTWQVGTAASYAPKPKPLSPLEWLDREVERTCALARFA